MRYNIDNEPIPILKCKNCGNEVNADQLPVMVDGLKCKNCEPGHFNKLIALDNISDCCEEPYYEYVW